ncbi:MAG: hypothetical protein FRX49_07623 [Trebouxia sp. A1-2]|nr:MAG: hypothetical protein FRX49_07623 [Trebouxia sp. A1-2]
MSSRIAEQHRRPSYQRYQLKYSAWSLKMPLLWLARQAAAPYSVLAQWVADLFLPAGSGLFMAAWPPDWPLRALRIITLVVTEGDASMDIRRLCDLVVLTSTGAGAGAGSGLPWRAAALSFSVGSSADAAVTTAGADSRLSWCYQLDPRPQSVLETTLARLPTFGEDANTYAQMW